MVTYPTLCWCGRLVWRNIQWLHSPISPAVPHFKSTLWQVCYLLSVPNVIVGWLLLLFGILCRKTTQVAVLLSSTIPLLNRLIYCILKCKWHSSNGSHMKLWWVFWRAQSLTSRKSQRWARARSRKSIRIPIIVSTVTAHSPLGHHVASSRWPRRLPPFLIQSPWRTFCLFHCRWRLLVALLRHTSCSVATHSSWNQGKVVSLATAVLLVHLKMGKSSQKMTSIR